MILVLAFSSVMMTEITLPCLIFPYDTRNVKMFNLVDVFYLFEDLSVFDRFDYFFIFKTFQNIVHFPDVIIKECFFPGSSLPK